MTISSTAYTATSRPVSPSRNDSDRRRVAQQLADQLRERADDERADDRAPDGADAADHGGHDRLDGDGGAEGLLRADEEVVLGVVGAGDGGDARS